VRGVQGGRGRCLYCGVVLDVHVAKVGIYTARIDRCTWGFGWRFMHVIIFEIFWRQISQ
jgi:hypothetical protein